MELFLLYLWLKLDGFLIVLFAFLVFGGITYGFMWIPRTDSYPTHNVTKFNKIHNRLAGAVLTALFLSLVIPSSKDVAILVGGKIALDVAKSPEGNKVATLLRGKANEYLDSELKKLQPIPVKKD